MGDTKFILFEFHQDGDLQFGPGTVSAGGLGGSNPDESVENPGEGTPDDLDFEVGGGRSSVVGGLLAIAAMVGLVLVLRKVLGGGSGAEEEVVDIGE